MPSWAWILLSLVALGAAAWAHLRFWTRRYTRPFMPDEVLDVVTTDAVRLAVARLRPRADGPAQGAPVVCWHGVACNSRTFDFEPGRSLGRYLAELGFDVYLVDLRGGGSSERSRRGRFGFFDYVDKDVPAVLAAVRARTGARRVLWVGHSMGGLIGYEHLAQETGDEDLAALVALGSPLNLGESRVELRFLSRLLPVLRLLMPVIHLSVVTRFLSPFAGRWRGYPESVFLNPVHTPGDVVRHFMVEVLEDVPRRVLEELATRLLRDRSVDGRPLSVVRERLSRTTVPTLVVSGAADGVAPLRACDVSAQRVDREHTAIVLSRAQGAPFDFGHLDLIVGDAAPKQVFAPVAAFLLAWAPQCQTPRPASGP